MESIKALVRNGRIETETPLNLPEGTRLLIVPRNPDDDQEYVWDDTPEGIDAWLRWYDSLDPLIFTAEEEKAWTDDRAQRKDWELAASDDHARKLRELWD